MWLGYSEPTLRLFPTVCSVLSLPLLWPRCRSVSAGTPKLLAVAVLAVSFYPIRHGAEIKPYASRSACRAPLAGSCRGMDAITGIQPVVVGADGIGADPGCHFLSRRLRGGRRQPCAGACGIEVKSTVGSTWMHCLQSRPGRVVSGHLLRLYGVSSGGHARQLPEWDLE